MAYEKGKPRSKAAQAKHMRTLAKQAAEATGLEREELIAKLKKDAKKADKICGAWIADKNRICSESPHIKEDGTSNGRCLAHGGNTTGPKTEEGKKRAIANLHPMANMIYGLYKDKFIFTMEEEEFYTEMMNVYITTYNLDMANIMLLDRALRNFIMNSRREVANADQEVQETESYSDFDAKHLRYMQALAFDRKFNQSISNADNAQKIDLAAMFLPTDQDENKE
ncbi:hypothetical protein EG878_14755 [Enterococcus faecalis]|nr:hypothetical protein EG878_14755 [Enterococcus faecalis]